MIMSDIFGSLVFNDTVMQERLPKYTYKELKSCIANDTPIFSVLRYRYSQRNERLGDRKRLHALYSLVPADDRRYRREA